MRDPNDQGERNEVKALLVAYSYMGAPMVLAELARHYLKEAENNPMGLGYHRVCKERAQILLDAAKALGPGCCEFHRTGGDMLTHCTEGKK